MVVACGLSQYSLALFHLINHAFFKALLFLSAGLVIHALVDQQDQRKMGSLVLFNPETYSLVLLGSLSLMAFPFLTGFYSKDLLLEIAIIPRNATILIGYLLILLAAFVTACYSACPHGYRLTQLVLCWSMVATSSLLFIGIGDLILDCSWLPSCF
jgi:NADH-ubiquinone oxidoreductase chain 5